MAASGLYTLAAVWGIFSLAGLPPLRDPAIAARLSGPLVVVATVSVLLYVFVAVRFYLLYRRRRSVVLLSIITANDPARRVDGRGGAVVNWRLSWWLWHVLMVLAFGYVAYSAYVGYRREGSTSGLFDGVRTDETVRAVRAEYEAALETLVGALRRQEAGEISANEMGLITAGMESRFGLTEGQTAVLGRAADALRAEREQIGRLAMLVAIGHESRVRLEEQDLLQRAVRRVADGFGSDGVRVGLLGGGHLRFPDELATDPTWQVADDMTRRAEESRRGPRRDGTGHPGRGDPRLPADRQGQARRGAADPPAGGFSERDRSLFASLASQLSMGMENARLYHQLDGLFRAYMSPDVATALLADPEQAALGGAVVEVTALFADLRGFTGFSERSTPEGIVVMLNRYFEHATAAILDEGGTVVQFVGDALMALFNAPARQDDHPVRAARAALAMQAAVEATAASSPGWPRFRVGINTGPALVGNIGSTALRSFNAMGDAVNVAARLESVAQPGQVVIGESTRARLPAGAAVESLGELAVKGRRSAVVAYRLFGLQRPGYESRVCRSTGSHR